MLSQNSFLTIASRLLGRKALHPLGTAAIVLLLLPPAAEAAAPKLFDCTLTQSESTDDMKGAQTEHRSIAMVVDEEAKTITLSQNGTKQALGIVSFSQSTINGYTDNISVGMDRSSGNFVLQSNGSNSEKIEFGTCSLKQLPPPHQ
jgi:hypothetical protein